MIENRKLFLLLFFYYQNNLCNIGYFEFFFKSKNDDPDETLWIIINFVILI